MLTFFRKQQKIIYFFVAGVVIVTFTVSAPMGGAPDEKNRVLTKAIGGEAIGSKDLRLLTSLLAEGDTPYEQYISTLNGHFIRDELLASGLAAKLYEAYESELKEDLQKRLEKLRAHRSYRHPSAEFFSAEMVWESLCPGAVARVERLKKMDATAEAFAELCALYTSVSCHTAREVAEHLMRQAQQLSAWLPQDPNFSRGDFSLTGFNTLEEWFGPKSVKLFVQTILNGASLAERKGYHVTRHEARGDLITRAMKTVGERGAAKRFLFKALKELRFEESKVEALFAKALLFKRLFDEVGHGTFLDSLTTQRFQNFVADSCQVSHYELAPLLRTYTLDDLMQVQTYIEKVGRDVKSPLALPDQVISAEEAKTHAPQFLRREYAVDIAQVSRESVAERVLLRDTWDWQTSDAGWKILMREFPQLRAGSAKTEEERLALLDSVDAKTRLAIDITSRSNIVAAHPEWMDEALKEAPMQPRTLSITFTGGEEPLQGVEDRAAFVAQLDALEPGETLKSYSPDKGRHLYAITMREKSGDWHLLTLAEAVESGILREIADRRLEDLYTTLKNNKSTRLQDEKGKVRPLSEVRSELIGLAFAEVFEAIRDDLGEESKELTLQQLARHRFDAPLRTLQEKVKTHPEPSHFLVKGDDALTDQWKLMREERIVTRANCETQQLFNAAAGEWSSVSGGKFSEVIARAAGSSYNARLAQSMKRPLVNEARAHLMQTLIAEMQEKRATHLSDQEVEEGTSEL